MWQPGCEWGLGEKGYMHMYGWVPLKFIWNYHNIADQLYSNTKLKVQKKKKNLPVKLLKGGTWERSRGITHHPQELSSFFRETMWGSVPLTLWESEALCRFHSTLGQTRNHSPECKPPILQDVGNLEQETTVTHTLTSLSLTPRSPVWGQKGSRAWRWSFWLRSALNPTPQMTTGQGRASYQLISLKEIPFSLEDFAPQI